MVSETCVIAFPDIVSGFMLPIESLEVVVKQVLSWQENFASVGPQVACRKQTYILQIRVIGVLYEPSWPGKFG